ASLCFRDRNKWGWEQKKLRQNVQYPGQQAKWKHIRFLPNDRYYVSTKDCSTPDCCGWKFRKFCPQNRNPAGANGLCRWFYSDDLKDIRIGRPKVVELQKSSWLVSFLIKQGKYKMKMVRYRFVSLPVSPRLPPNRPGR